MTAQPKLQKSEDVFSMSSFTTKVNGLDQAKHDKSAGPTQIGPAAKAGTKASTPSHGDYTRGIDPAILRLSQPAYAAVARMIHYALIADMREVWAEVMLMLIINLGPRERLGLARAAAFSLEPEDRADFAEELHISVTGLPPLFRPYDDLDLYADEASENDLARCIKKCFDRLPSRRQIKALAYIAECLNANISLAEYKPASAEERVQ